MDKQELKEIKINDLVLFKLRYKDLDVEYCIGFIQAMNNKCFTISQYEERVTFLKIPQFESLVHYEYIRSYKILAEPSNLLRKIRR